MTNVRVKYKERGDRKRTCWIERMKKRDENTRGGSGGVVALCANQSRAM